MTLTQLLAAEAKDPAYRPLPTRQAYEAVIRAQQIELHKRTKLEGDSGKPQTA